MMQQTYRMLHLTDRLSPQPLLRPLSVLVFHLLLTSSGRGQSLLIGLPQSIVAGVGEDVILPCYLKPAMDVTKETVEWKRRDIDPRFVHEWRSGQELVDVKNPSYRGRTSLFINELKNGNISLKLSKVQLSDQGTYICDIPLQHKQSSVKLVVASDTASLPVISLAGIDRNGRGVILNCDSNSWFPKPELIWLDGEGHVLSAGPTETVRGPDGLYTVSSRVTVEKRHRNNFTCRVQQKKINQTRETHVGILDDFFQFQSSSFDTTVGLAVCLALCIPIILFLVLFVWRHKHTTEKGAKRKYFKGNKSEDRFVAEDEIETELLWTDETTGILNEEKGQKKSKHDESQCEVYVNSQTDDNSSISWSSTTGPLAGAELGHQDVRRGSKTERLEIENVV